MSNFKSSGFAKVKGNIDILKSFGVEKGDIVKIITISENWVNAYNEKYSGTVLKEGVVCFHKQQLIPLMDYESSNRYKLKQAIKETGISSRKLSHFAVGNESFFYNQTGPARFKEYGDISESKLEELIYMVGVAKKRLNAKITQDAFDEREKLDLAAKTVDENNVPIIVEKPKWKYQGEVTVYLGQPSNNSVKKRNNNLRNFMIVLVVFLIMLALWFFSLYVSN